MRRALIVGIDEYPNCPLTGCVADARRLTGVLARHRSGRLNFQCDTVTAPADTVTRSLLREKLYRLFRDDAEAAFFHFSGHGTSNNLGGHLITPDGSEFDPGISMAEILALANQSPVRDIFITLDCCHSGLFGAVPAISNEGVFLKEGISVITATRAGQEALEEGGGGIFTSLLVEALEGGAADILGNISAASVYAYIDNALGAWDQRPLFKAHVSSFTRMREAAPRVEHGLLLKLPDYFPLPAEELPLCPDYEPDAEPHDEDKERIFRHLQSLRYAGLVEPKGALHMYHAAIQSKACALTTLGKYYWRLVKEGKL